MNLAAFEGSSVRFNPHGPDSEYLPMNGLNPREKWWEICFRFVLDLRSKSYHARQPL